MSEPADRCYFFGCWNSPGHFMRGPGDSTERHRLEYVDKAQSTHLDGTLAPRSRAGVRVMWQAQFKRGERQWHDGGAEYPQGHFLRHELETGFTAIQWWDRCQGDTRGACNSTILLEGRHTSAEMLSALSMHYPHVLANLEKHGIHLVEVSAEDDRPAVRWYSQVEMDAVQSKLDALVAHADKGIEEEGWTLLRLAQALETGGVLHRLDGRSGDIDDRAASVLRRFYALTHPDPVSP